VATREGHSGEPRERADGRAGPPDDRLHEVVGESHADHGHGEEDDHAARSRARDFEDRDQRGDDEHVHRAAQVGEASEHARARIGGVGRCPPRDVEVEPSDEGLSANLERQHGHGDQERQ